MLGGDQWRFLSHNVAGGNIPGVEEKWPWAVADMFGGCPIDCYLPTVFQCNKRAKEKKYFRWIV